MNIAKTALRLSVLPALFLVSIGVFRNGVWYMDTNQNGAWDPGTDAVIEFGMAAYSCYGNWNGSGRIKSYLQRRCVS